jgi:hypothetical protein
VNAQVPPAAALQSTPAAAPVPAVALDARAAIVTDRLSAASGRSLGSLAESVEAPLPAETPEAPTVGSAEEVTERYAETLAQLSEAEAAAAEDLAMTEEEVAAAEKERTRAARELAAEEAAAARQVDAAIDAAIAAAQAESAYQDYVGDLAAGGSIPSGRSTGTTEVLALVRKNFPASQVGNAMAVSRCESGHANRVSQPNTNGSRDFGVFQINDGGTLQAALRTIGVSFTDIGDARQKALDPALNVRLARAIWDARGWQPWTCAAKLQIVAGLYERAPGPMDGQYDEYGRPL